MSPTVHVPFVSTPDPLIQTAERPSAERTAGRLRQICPGRHSLALRADPLFGSGGPPAGGPQSAACAGGYLSCRPASFANPIKPIITAWRLVEAVGRLRQHTPGALRLRL